MSCLLCVYVTFWGPLRDLLNLINVAVSLTTNNQTAYGVMVGAQSLYVQSALKRLMEGYHDKFANMIKADADEDDDIEEFEKKPLPKNVYDVVDYDDVVKILNEVLFMFLFWIC